jgi:hypothetical protein
VTSLRPGLHCDSVGAATGAGNWTYSPVDRCIRSAERCVQNQAGLSRRTAKRYSHHATGLEKMATFKELMGSDELLSAELGTPVFSSDIYSDSISELALLLLKLPLDQFSRAQKQCCDSECRETLVVRVVPSLCSLVPLHTLQCSTSVFQNLCVIT